MPTTVGLLDLHVSEYVNHLFQEGDSISHAGWLLSGLKRFLPRLKKELATSQQYFANWQRDHLPLRAVPMPWTVLKVLASLAWRASQFDISLCLLLGFGFYLRTMEMLKLRIEDIAIRGSCVYVALRDTKTSKNFTQSLVVRNAHLANIVTAGLRQLPPAGPLWRYQPKKFRDSFKLLLEHVHLAHLNFSLYSIRRGGATHAYVVSRNIDDVAIRGRWKDIRTARIYLDDARASLLKQHLPEGWQLFQREAAKVWHEFK
eukprot:Skav210163  [mRNA]  locus=scaffold5301:41969:42745:- [translate_table: standard]